MFCFVFEDVLYSNTLLFKVHRYSVNSLGDRTALSYGNRIPMSEGL